MSNRTIRQEPKFNEQLAAALSRHPEQFPRVPGTQISIIKTPVYPNAPSLRIFFTYSEEEVHLLVVEFCEEEVPPPVKYEE